LIRKKKKKKGPTRTHQSFLKQNFWVCGFVTTAACFIFRFSERLVSRFLEVVGECRKEDWNTVQTETNWLLAEYFQFMQKERGIQMQ